MTMLKKNSLKLFFLAFVGYAAAGGALFGPFLDNPFLMDDEIQVTHNVHIQNISEWPQYFTSSTMDSGGGAKMGGIYFKPLMTVYFATIWHLFGENAFAFRLPLLICHVLSSALIFIFLIQFFEGPIAFLCGLLFVVHPINSEIVAYIADAQDALYFVFGLLGLVTFLWLKQTWLACVALGVCLMASLLSKETGALFLAIVPMATFYFDRSRLKAALGVAFVIAVIYASLRIHSGLLSYEHRVLLIQQASYLERLMTVPLIIWHYIEVFVFPLRISLVTDFAVHSLSVALFWLPLLGVLIFIGALRLLWTRLKTDIEKRVFEFSVGILFLWFALHGSVVLPLDGTFADRWFYLGTWALLMCGALACKVFFESLTGNRARLAKRVVATLVVLFTVGASARTWVRLKDWEIPMNLYQRELALRPFDALMANNVGFEFFRRGDVREAEKFFDLATKNNPSWDVAWNNLGACAQRLNEPDRALGLYEKSVSLGSYYLAYENYAALICSQRIDNNCRAFAKRALDLFPLNPKIQQIDAAIRQHDAQKYF